MVEAKELEARVSELEKKYYESALAFQCKRVNSAGKVILEAVETQDSLLIQFDDDTYMYFEAERDDDTGVALCECLPSRSDIEMFKLGDSGLLDQLRRARQALNAVKGRAMFKSKMEALVKDIGKENILRLLKEIP